MIKNYRSKALRQFAEKGAAGKLPVENLDRIRRLLLALQAIVRPGDMDLPGLFFHPLKGRDKGRYSIRVTGNWRLTFGWDGQDVIDVDLEDYH